MSSGERTELSKLFTEAGSEALVVGLVDLPSDLPSHLGAIETTTIAPFARSQLPTRYRLIILGPDTLAGSDAQKRLVFHNCAGHLVPGGILASATVDDTLEHHATACGFTTIEAERGATFHRWQRSERQTVHDLLSSSRRSLDRITAQQLHGALRAEGIVILDTRTPTDRETHGVIPGSIHTPRTVVEWRCDPASGYTHPAITSFGQVLVVVCNDGYSSSLAAESLQRIGFSRATDLIGGVRGWIESGFSVEAPSDNDDIPPIPEELW